MYNYFKNISEKNSCQFEGVCSIHPSVNALYQVLLSEVREISFYLVKLKEFGMTNIPAMAFCIEALSVFLINTSFNQENYLNFLAKLYSLKQEIKQKYLSYCAQNEFPCEIISTNLEINEKTTISQLIKHAQNIQTIKQKNEDRKKHNLFELITIFARLCAINIVKIKKIDETFNKYDFEILRFFALTNSYSIRCEKIIRRINEFSSIAYDIICNLNRIYEQKYGKKQDANISTSAKAGHGILVSGDDLDELEALLELIEKTNSKEKINVYTNGPLILAHFYPYFKNNSHLKGHLGSDNAQYDFSIFPGSILITQNFIQKIDSLYRGEIFSNKLISFSKVFDIEGKNYEPVIESALRFEGFRENGENTNLNITYDKEKIEDIIENFNDKKITLIAGYLPLNPNFETYQNEKIINFNCPLENNVLFNAIERLKLNNVEITLFFAQCNLSNLLALLSLLNKNIKLNIASCPYPLINPHVIEALKEDFSVNII